MKESLIFIFLVMVFTSCASLRQNEVFKKSMTTNIDKSKLNRTEYYKKLGLNHKDNSNIEEAIEYFKLSLLHDSKNNDSRFYLAQCYEEIGKEQLAYIEYQQFLTSQNKQYSEFQIKVLNQYLEKTKSYDKIYELNQKFYQETKSAASIWKMYEMSLLMKKFDQALKVLSLFEPQKLTKENQFLVLLAKAEIEAAQNKFIDALKIIATAESISAFDEMLLKKKLQYLENSEQWSEVLITGQKYIKYQKHNLFISEVIAKAALKIENYQYAIDEFEWQMQFQEHKNLTKLKIAHLNFLLKKYDVAEKQYQEIAGYPELEDEIKYYLSRIYDQTNRSDLALKTLADIDSSSIYFADTQVRLATIDYNNNDISSALNRLRKAHLIKPDSIAIYKLYSDYLIENKSYAEAVALLEKGIDNTTPNEVLHMNLAFIHYKLRNYVGFRKEYQTVMAINPANARTYEMLAELWYKDDKKSSEIEYFASLAMKLGTENENLMKILAWVYVDQNKLDEAVKLFEDLYDKNPKDFFYSEMLSKIYFLKNIPEKSNQFALIARQLNGEINIKDYLTDLFKTRKAGPDYNIYEDQRKPASLE